MSVSIVLVPDASLSASELSDAEIIQAASAIQAWIDTEVAPPWSSGWAGHYPCHSVARGAPVPAASAHTWLVHLKATSDVGAGTLGYHTRDAQGNPVLFVFVVDAISHGVPWFAVLAHEVVETLVDRFVNSGVLGTYQGAPAFFFVEAGDPFEAGPRYWFTHNGIQYQVCNFAFPSYFIIEAAPPYDRLHLGTAPLTPTAGGRQEVFPVTGESTLVGASRVPSTPRRHVQRPSGTAVVIAPPA